MLLLACAQMSAITKSEEENHYVVTNKEIDL